MSGIPFRKAWNIRRTSGRHYFPQDFIPKNNWLLTSVELDENLIQQRFFSEKAAFMLILDRNSGNGLLYGEFLPIPRLF